MVTRPNKIMKTKSNMTVKDKEKKIGFKTYLTKMFKKYKKQNDKLKKRYIETIKL